MLSDATSVPDDSVCCSIHGPCTVQLCCILSMYVAACKLHVTAMYDCVLHACAACRMFDHVHAKSSTLGMGNRHLNGALIESVDEDR